MEQALREELQSRMSWENNPICGTLKIYVDLIDDDRAEGHMDITHGCKNPGGYVHGGAIFTLCDSIGGLAVISDGHRYVTQSSSISFLGNQQEGVIHASAEVLNRSKRTCLVRVSLTGDSGRKVAEAMLNFFRTDL